MEATKPSKRKSLRNSVLKRGAGNGLVRRPAEEDQQSGHAGGADHHKHGFIFGGLKPFFHDQDDDFFPSFGFRGPNPFGEGFDRMMEKFFSDFNPESFADSRFYNEDRDLDEDVSKRGLDGALDKQTWPSFGGLESFSGSFSHSESIITRPDGTIERKVTRKDADGNVSTETTITRPDGSTESVDDGPLDIRRPRQSNSRDNDIDWSYQSWDNQGLRGIYDRIKKWWTD